jgi:hypothetical protein
MASAARRRQSELEAVRAKSNFTPSITKSVVRALGCSIAERTFAGSVNENRDVRPLTFHNHQADQLGQRRLDASRINLFVIPAARREISEDT